jgi:hypothetical protein
VKQITVSVIAFLLLFLPSSAFAKGKTVKITIEGARLRAPIEITDSHALAPFNVWAGPNPAMGTSSFDSQPSFVAEWSSGPVHEPSRALPRYKVSFWTDDREKVAYVVLYAYNPVAKQGYVYLPGEKDDSYGLNIGTMLRGVEGNWFPAWRAWDRIAVTLISTHI